MARKYEQVYRDDVETGPECGTAHFGFDDGMSRSSIVVQTTRPQKYRVTVERIIEEPKLKPCPFCGGESVRHTHVTGSMEHLIICNVCWAMLKWDSKHEVSEKWNRRP